MIDLMQKLASLCPEWCELDMNGNDARGCLRILDLLGRGVYLHEQAGDVDNGRAILAIVQRMVEAGWEVHKTSYKQQDGKIVYGCEAYRRLGEEIDSGYLSTETESILKAAVAAFGEEPPSKR